VRLDLAQPQRQLVQFDADASVVSKSEKKLKMEKEGHCEEDEGERK